MSVIPSIKVTIYIWGNQINFEKVTNIIGIIPTSVRKKEEFPPQSIAANVARDFWSYSVKEENAILLRSVFKPLLELFKPKIEQVCKVCSDYNLSADLEIVIHMNDGEGPEVVLSREVVNFAASINAEIGFDLYCYE